MLLGRNATQAWVARHEDLYIIGPCSIADNEMDTTLGPLHTQDWEPVTITLQALPLVEKAEPVQVHFTLRTIFKKHLLRDQQSMWMQDGC